MKKIKVYELTRLSGCIMEFNYCGNKIRAEFRNGSPINMRKASVVTSNPFVQDALEKDPRFNVEYKLAAEYDDEVDVQKEEKKFTQQKVRGSKYTEVPEVQTSSDAVYYFQQLGETVEDDGKIQELADHYKVRFPNLNKQ